MKLSYFHIHHAFSFKTRTIALLKICIRVWNLLNIFFFTWKCVIHIYPFFLFFSPVPYLFAHAFTVW